MNNADSKNWRIEFGEKPIKVGILDNILLGGRDMSHSFLRLRHADGRIVSELHGFAYDVTQNTTVPFSFSPLKRLKHNFGLASDQTYKPDCLRVLAFNYEKTRGDTVRSRLLYEGDEEDTLSRWIMAQRRATEINRKGFTYNFISVPGMMHVQNCHNVSGALIEAMGLELPETAYFTPGLRTKLQGLSLPFSRAGLETFHQGTDALKGKMQELNEALNRGFTQARRSVTESYQQSSFGLSFS